MREIYRFFTSVILIFSFAILAYSQEHDFHKHAYKFIKATDHENDARVHFYDVGFYFIDLELSNTSKYLEGNARIDLNLNGDYNDELVFELKSNLTIDSIKVNNSLESYNHTDDIVIIDYTHVTDFNENYNVSAVIYYHGTPTAGVFNETDIYESESFEFTYTLSEPYSAKYWFPCKQILTDKADSSYFYVTLDENLKVGSNGLLVDEYSIGSGKKRMEWQSSYPIVYYLISYAIGDYQDYSFVADIPNYGVSVPVQNFIPNNAVYLANTDWYINRTEEMLCVLSDKWGLYPHHEEKYGHCIVPLGGGMEHQTMTSLGNFGFGLVIHELSHSWFGDYLTCATWQDIWINEGFASYGEYIGEEFIQPDGFELAWLNTAHNYAKEASTGSVYVPFEELNNVGRIFNYRLSYRKGASLVHMIRYMIEDDDLFFATLREFLTIYGNGTATGDDLLVVLEAETSISFGAFFEEWYYGEGYPTYSVEWWQDGSNLHIESTQTTSAPATTLFTIPMEFKIIYDDDSELISRQNYNANFQTYDIPVTGTIVEVITNPSSAVLADVSTIQNIEKQPIAEGFKIYPNPSNGEFKLFTDKQEEYLIQVFDINGKLIYAQNHSGYFNKLNFSDFAKGIYTLKLSDTKSMHVKRLVIN